jgi:uncharacterized membrane protein
MSGALFALTLVAALGCGLAAGVFFAFSSFVMKGLARLEAPQGIAAMNAVNAAAETPAFMLELAATAAACAAAAVAVVLDRHEPYAVWLLAGSALYLLGVIGLTAVYHVPRNNALAAVDPTGAGASGHWTRYVVGWTRWNHLRTAAPLAAAAAFSVALAGG